jgi:uncharacterized protein YbjT (DUF2867 family)
MSIERFEEECPDIGSFACVHMTFGEAVLTIASRQSWRPEEFMKTLLVGAAGLLGSEICQRLSAAGHQARALVRPTAAASKRAALVELGVELVAGVARAAAAAATEGARNMVVELGGPQALSPREVVRMFEAAGAGEIATESVPESALEAQMNAATDSLQKSFAGLMLQCAAGDVVDTTTSNRLFPFKMTSMRDFITAQLAAAR